MNLIKKLFKHQKIDELVEDCEFYKNKAAEVQLHNVKLRREVAILNKVIDKAMAEMHEYKRIQKLDHEQVKREITSREKIEEQIKLITQGIRVKFGIVINPDSMAMELSGTANKPNYKR